VDAGSVLGLPALRPSLLVHLSTAESGESEGGHRAFVVTKIDNPEPLMTRFDLDDDLDDEPDEDEDDFDEDDEGEDGDEEADEDEETETWQVSAVT